MKILRDITPLICLSIVALSTLLSSCITIKKDQSGTRFFSSENAWENEQLEMTSFLKKGLWNLDRQKVLARFGPAHEELDGPSIKTYGWKFDVVKNQALDLAFYRYAQGTREEYMLAVAFDQEGTLVDYYTWSSRLPQREDKWQTDPFFRVAVTAVTAYKLSDLLAKTLDRASSKIESRIQQKLEAAAKDLKEQHHQRYGNDDIDTDGH